MEHDKIRQIIRNKNEQLERLALRTAEEIIGSIADQQRLITAAEGQIQNLRHELKQLVVEQLDPTVLLGE